MYKLKAIEGFENYSVSTDGEVINTVTNKKLRLSLKKCGYLQVGLSNKKVKAWFIVHRLVAKAFIDNPDNKEFVNHIDGDKTNNNVNNLEWVTHQENMNHAKNHNLIKRGNENPRSKLNDELVEEICKMLEYGLRNIDISRTLNVPSCQISMIRAGTCWQHISCKYNIPKRSRTHSDETIKWVKQKIKEGLTQSEILKLSSNNRLNKFLIQDLRTDSVYKDV